MERAFASGHPKVTATCFTVSLAGLMLSCTAFHLLFALICYFTIGEHFFTSNSYHIGFFTLDSVLYGFFTLSSNGVLHFGFFTDNVAHQW